MIEVVTTVQGIRYLIKARYCSGKHNINIQLYWSLNKAGKPIKSHWRKNMMLEIEVRRYSSTTVIAQMVLAATEWCIPASRYFSNVPWDRFKMPPIFLIDDVMDAIKKVIQGDEK